jgi:hypothetical protein
MAKQTARQALDTTTNYDPLVGLVGECTRYFGGQPSKIIMLNNLELALRQNPELSQELQRMMGEMVDADYCECGRVRSRCVGGYAKNRETIHADKEYAWPQAPVRFEDAS